MITHIVQRVLLGAALSTAIPTAALAATPVRAPAHTAPVEDADRAVARFYQARASTPMWLSGSNRNASDALLRILRDASIDGLAEGPALASSAEAALARGDLLQADRILSTAWVRYVQAIRTPSAGMIYGDPSLTPRVPAAETILAHAAAARDVASHVEQIARVNPFYAALRKAARETAGATNPDRRVLANLERARAIPGSGTYVLVDAAAQQLYMVENGEIRDRMKVVVGKPDHATPMLASTIRQATVNPYWNVPPDLVQANIAPKVLREGVGYLQKHRYEVLSGFDENATVIAPESVDWEAVSDGRLMLRVRQLPGGDNFMGEIKFSFPNNGGIFLHDTPERHLFNEATRTFSSGCVRLEDAPRLARWLLGRLPQPVGDAPEQHVQLPQPVPVYITYLTAQVRDGEIAFVEDVYDRDKEMRTASGG